MRPAEGTSAVLAAWNLRSVILRCKIKSHLVHELSLYAPGRNHIGHA